MSTDTDDLDDPDRLLLGGGTASSHMMEKFRGVKNEMRRRILQTRDIIGDGKVISIITREVTGNISWFV
jgi:hypothetical protein